MNNVTTLPSEIQLEILDLIEEGWSIEDIATHLNINKDDVLKQG